MPADRDIATLPVGDMPPVLTPLMPATDRTLPSLTSTGHVFDGQPATAGVNATVHVPSNCAARHGELSSGSMAA